MTGKGPKHERETIISFNEEEDTAFIWTASDLIYRRLIKNGYMPIDESDRSARFKIPKLQLRLPKPPSKARQDIGRALAERRKAATASPKKD